MITYTTPKQQKLFDEEGNLFGKKNETKKE